MSNWPSSKANRVFSALQRVGWRIKRKSGSHKTMSREGWPDFVFAFHEREEIGPRMLARIAKHTGLKPEDLTASRPPFWPSLARWIVSSVNSFVHFVPLLLVSPFSRPAAWAIYRHWGHNACRIFGVTLSLRDDNDGNLGPKPHLYVWLNQTSLTDTVAIAQLLPPTYAIGNIEYAMMPLVGWAIVPLRFVVIVRQWKAQAKRGIERAAAGLARGQTWVISAEGSRTPDGRLLPFKKGPVVLALKTQATIIPLAIHGAREVMPSGEWRLRPGHIEVHLLKSLSTRGLTYDDRDAVLEQLRVLAERELAPVSRGA